MTIRLNQQISWPVVDSRTLEFSSYLRADNTCLRETKRRRETKKWVEFLLDSIHCSTMSGASLKSFGVVIAFLLPGFIATLGLSLQSPIVTTWIQGHGPSQPSVGGMLFSTVLSLWNGLIASTVRWLVVDKIHRWTGIRKTNWDYRKLQANISAYQLLEENHYRFYQFYGNSFCAVIFTFGAWRLTNPTAIGWPELGFALILLLLFLGSRDTLQKYYLRVDALLDSDVTQ